jgi:formylglycine-generating enzyme required for sulfatase activity
LRSRVHFSVLTLRIAAAFAALASIAIVVQLAALERSPPVRCPAGLLEAAGRCCGLGQTLVGTRCEGRATSCGPEQHFLEPEAGQPAGCVYLDQPVPLSGGKLPAGAADWQRGRAASALEVAAFRIDRGEVTLARYAECVASRVCPSPRMEREPGLPVTGISAQEAERYCRFVGGRLPSSAEWRFAASGSEGRRFAWGFTGLVCRRAAFGLVRGPCATEGTGPDLVGARPDGNTPQGLVDLSGNVAEWTRDPDGRYRARGGSYLARVAVELTTSAVELASSAASHIGFRCAYDERAQERESAR